MSFTKNSLINLFLFSDTGSIWKCKDWERIRRQHRITGNLIGTIAQQPHQIRERGLPLLLTKNETKLLQEKGFAELWLCSKFLKEPSKEEAESFQHERQHCMSSQVEELKELRKREILEMAPSIVEGKLSKRVKLDRAVETNLEHEREKIISEQIADIPEPNERYLMIQTYTEDPWLEGEAIKSWDYPKSEREKLEYATFRRLWEMGYWVTPGGKFGADFLVYTGDPLLFHATFIVRLSHLNGILSPLDIAAQVRLANTTRKTAVLAYFDADQIVNFQSFAWCND